MIKKEERINLNQHSISIIDKVLSLDRRLTFLMNLTNWKIKKDDLFTYSMILEKSGYSNLSQKDLRLLLDDLVKLEILCFRQKNRYGNKEYSINQKKLISYIYNSELCSFIKEIIKLEVALAIV